MNMDIASQNGIALNKSIPIDTSKLDDFIDSSTPATMSADSQVNSI